VPRGTARPELQRQDKKTCSKKTRQNEPRLNQLLIQFDLSAEIKCCTLPTWWLWRGGCTRSHSEHGRETPLRQWYFVLRRGRVGRCQVCKAQHLNSEKRHHIIFSKLQPTGQQKGSHMRPSSHLRAIKQPSRTFRKTHNAGQEQPLRTAKGAQSAA